MGASLLLLPEWKILGPVIHYTIVSVPVSQLLFSCNENPAQSKSLLFRWRGEFALKSLNLWGGRVGTARASSLAGLGRSGLATLPQSSIRSRCRPPLRLVEEPAARLVDRRNCWKDREQ
jgi:hypothetical protein